MKDLPLVLISLSNICLCYIGKRKAKYEVILRPESEPGDGLLLGAGQKACSYWKESETGKIPKLDQVRDAYEAAVEALGSVQAIPAELRELYQSAKKKDETRGRGKLTRPERERRAIYAATLAGIADFERANKAGLFPIKTREEARRLFYAAILRKTSHFDGNGKSCPFNTALCLAGGLRKKVSFLLGAFYLKGYRGGLPLSYIDLQDVDTVIFHSTMLLSGSPCKAPSVEQKTLE